MADPVPDSQSTDVTLKRQAARDALSLLPERGIVGLGSGSTATLFIEELAELVARGRELKGVATSELSRKNAERLGIEVLPDSGPWAIDITVDGADEVTPRLELIKGGGGCQTREKIVSHASRRNIILVDESKLSERLGEKRAVPVEVLRFGHLATAERLDTFGNARLRAGPDGKPTLTDAGNLLYDLVTGPIDDPVSLERALQALPGVVETGLFLGRADVVIVASTRGTRFLKRSGVDKR